MSPAPKPEHPAVRCGMCGDATGIGGEFFEGSERTCHSCGRTGEIVVWTPAEWRLASYAVSAEMNKLEQE